MHHQVGQRREKITRKEGEKRRRAGNGKAKERGRKKREEMKKDMAVKSRRELSDAAVRRTANTPYFVRERGCCHGACRRVVAHRVHGDKHSEA